MRYAFEALIRVDASIKLVSRLDLPDSPPASTKAVQALGAADKPPLPPGPEPLEELRRRLFGHYRGKASASPSRRDIRYAPWVLWNGQPRAAELPELLHLIFEKAGSSRRLASALVEAWIRDFQNGDEAIAEAGKRIAQLLAASGSPTLSHWLDLHRKFSFFDATKGPNKIAVELLLDSRPPMQILESVRLNDTEHASSGYLRATLEKLLANLPSTLRRAGGDEPIERTLAVLVTPDGTLRFGDGLRGEIGRGLLAPWLDGKKEPSFEARTLVQEFLLKYLGDPRVRGAKWSPVGGEGTALVRRWLARASLRAFFALVGDHALDRHWRYREAFWTACLDRNAIEDAWVVFAKGVLYDARAQRELGGAYGQLDDVSGDQSVLLMRIGPLTFCEWSHMGKLRAWLTDSDNAPKLYQGHYKNLALRKDGLLFPPNPEFGSKGTNDGKGLSHFNSDASYWQGSVAAMLRQRVNLKLTEADWTP
jgi:hypothetical protein